MRTYEGTHPWLTFRAELGAAGIGLWMALGEAVSKCEHLAGVPLMPKVAEELHRVFLAKGVWATTAIEGNTLSEEQVRQRVQGQLPLPPSAEYLGQEVDNIVAATNSILSRLVEGGDDRVTPEAIKGYNRQVLSNLETGPDVVPGQVRTHSVAVAGYTGAPAEDCELLLDKLCVWLNDADAWLRGASPMANGILRAIYTHLYIAWIHPFGDGNGRTARLVEFQILVASGVPSVAAHLLSNHYSLTRQQYYRELDRASRSGGDALPFVQYAVTGFVDGLRSQLQMVREQQLSLAWSDYVNDMLSDTVEGKLRQVNRRRRTLVLHLASKPDSVPLGEITDIGPEVARWYATKTTKTLQRDLKALVDLGLITRVGGDRFRANREIILAFLPAQREP